MCFPARHLCQISQKKLLRKPLNLKGLGRGGPNLLTLSLSPRRLEQLCRERSELCLLQTEGDSSLLKPSNHLKAYIGVGGWSGRVLCPGLTLDCGGETGGTGALQALTAVASGLASGRNLHNPPPFFSPKLWFIYFSGSYLSSHLTRGRNVGNVPVLKIIKLS